MGTPLVCKPHVGFNISIHHDVCVWVCVCAYVGPRILSTRTRACVSGGANLSTIARDVVALCVDRYTIRAGGWMEVILMAVTSGQGRGTASCMESSEGTLRSVESSSCRTSTTMLFAPLKLKSMQSTSFETRLAKRTRT